MNTPGADHANAFERPECRDDARRRRPLQPLDPIRTLSEFLDLILVFEDSWSCAIPPSPLLNGIPFFNQRLLGCRSLSATVHCFGCGDNPFDRDRRCGRRSSWSNWFGAAAEPACAIAALNHAVARSKIGAAPLSPSPGRRQVRTFAVYCGDRNRACLPTKNGLRRGVGRFSREFAVSRSEFPFYATPIFLYIYRL